MQCLLCLETVTVNMNNNSTEDPSASRIGKDDIFRPLCCGQPFGCRSCVKDWLEHHKEQETRIGLSLPKPKCVRCFDPKGLSWLDEDAAGVYERRCVVCGEELPPEVVVERTRNTPSSPCNCTGSFLRDTLSELTGLLYAPVALALGQNMTNGASTSGGGVETHLHNPFRTLNLIKGDDFAAQQSFIRQVQQGISSAEAANTIIQLPECGHFAHGMCAGMRMNWQCEHVEVDDELHEVGHRFVCVCEEQKRKRQEEAMARATSGSTRSSSGTAHQERSPSEAAGGARGAASSLWNLAVAAAQAVPFSPFTSAGSQAPVPPEQELLRNRGHSQHQRRRNYSRNRRQLAHIHHEFADVDSGYFEAALAGRGSVSFPS
eukprot:g9633.t1